MLHIRASLCHISCFGHGLSSRQAALSVYAPFGYAQGTTQPPPAYFSARLLCRSGFGRFCFLVAINQGNKKRPCVISVAYIKAKIFCVCHTYIVCTRPRHTSSCFCTAHPRSARRWLAPQRIANRFVHSSLHFSQPFPNAGSRLFYLFISNRKFNF